MRTITLSKAQAKDRTKSYIDTQCPNSNDASLDEDFQSFLQFWSNIARDNNAHDFFRTYQKHRIDADILQKMFPNFLNVEDFQTRLASGNRGSLNSEALRTLMAERNDSIKQKEIQVAADKIRKCRGDTIEFTLEELNGIQVLRNESLGLWITPTRAELALLSNSSALDSKSSTEQVMSRNQSTSAGISQPYSPTQNGTNNGSSTRPYTNTPESRSPQHIITSTPVFIILKKQEVATRVFDFYNTSGNNDEATLALAKIASLQSPSLSCSLVDKNGDGAVGVVWTHILPDGECLQFLPTKSEIKMLRLFLDPSTSDAAETVIQNDSSSAFSFLNSSGWGSLFSSSSSQPVSSINPVETTLDDLKQCVERAYMKYKDGICNSKFGVSALLTLKEAISVMCGKKDAYEVLELFFEYTGMDHRRAYTLANELVKLSDISTQLPEIAQKDAKKWTNEECDAFLLVLNTLANPVQQTVENNQSQARCI